MLSADDIRQQWRDYCAAGQEMRRADAAFRAAFMRAAALGLPLPKEAKRRSIPFPDICRGMTCGARTRAGTPCKRMDLYRSGRCKLHGGLSTGPTSAKGKAIAAGNSRHRGANQRTP